MQRVISMPAEQARGSGLGLIPRLLRALLRLILLALFRWDVRGLERLPRGACIVAPNHPAWLETFALFAFLPARKGLRILAERERTLGVGWQRLILDRADAIVPIDVEGRESRSAMRTVVEYLRNGSAIGIFPEDLSEPTPPDGSVRPLRRGVAFLARAAGVPVVPLGVDDTRELWRGRRIRLVVGEPLEPPHAKEQDVAFLAELRGRIDRLRPKPEPLPARRPWRWLSRLF